MLGSDSSDLEVTKQAMSSHTAHIKDVLLCAPHKTSFESVYLKAFLTSSSLMLLACS